MLTKNTSVFISVAKVPGTFGLTVYNELFKIYGIDAIYLPRVAPPPNELVQSLRALGISGCSVTMPLKSSVIPYLDNIDAVAKIAQSVNTIVNRNGVLTGFNTDVYGAEQALRGLEFSNVLVFGSGGVLGSLVSAVRSLGAREISFLPRIPRPEIAAKLGITELTLTEAVKRPFDLLVNATPTFHAQDTPLCELLKNCRLFFDCVVAPEPTELVRHATDLGRRTVQGWEMSQWQLEKQFEIYTGVLPDRSAIANIIMSSWMSPSQLSLGR